MRRLSGQAALLSAVLVQGLLGVKDGVVSHALREPQLL